MSDQPLKQQPQMCQWLFLSQHPYTATVALKSSGFCFYYFYYLAFVIY